MIIVDKLSPIGFRDTLPHSGAEAGCFLNGAQSNILQPILGVFPGVAGDLRKLGFLLRRETYFHAPRLRILPACVNSQSKG